MRSSMAILPPGLRLGICAALFAIFVLNAGLSNHVGADVERQTKLILPRVAPDAKPELVPQAGHADWVCAVCFSPDQKLLASGSGDTTLILWDLVGGQEVRRLRGHSAWAMSAAFSPDGTRLASGGWDEAVILWEVKTGRLLWKAKAHTGLVFAVAFSPDGKKLASGASDHKVIVWEVETGRQLFTLNGHTGAVTCLAFSPDGATLVSGSSDKTAIQWDAQTGGRVATYDGNRRDIASVAFSPDGEELATGSYPEISEKYEVMPAEVALWNLKSGRAAVRLTGPPTAVLGLRFSRDGKTLLSAGLSTVIGWDVATGRQVQWFTRQQGAARAAAFSPDATRVAWGLLDGSVVVCDAVAGARITRLTGRTCWSDSVCLSPDGRVLASGTRDTQIILWDAATGHEIRRLEMAAEQPSGGSPNTTPERVLILSLSFSPDGSKLACGGGTYGQGYGDVAVWDVKAGKRLFWRRLMGQNGTALVSCVRFSPDGRKIASGSVSGGAAVIWDASSGAPLLALDATTGGPARVAPISQSDPGPRAFSVSPGRPDQSAPSGQKRHYVDAVTPVAFSPDGRKLASAWLGDDAVLMWDLHSGRQLARWTGHDGWITSLAFSPDGSKLASGSEDKTVVIWDARTGRAARLLKEHSEAVVSVAFSRDGRMLATGSNDRTVEVYQVAGWHPLAKLSGHGGWCSSVGFSPDGHKLATGAFEGGVGVWETTHNGSVLATVFGLEKGRDWLVATPEGYYDCSLEAANSVMWRLGEQIYPFDQFSERFQRPDLVRKALAGQDISSAPPLNGSQIPPNLAFRAPDYGAQVSGDKVEVTIEAAGAYPIQRLEMTVNGRTVPAEVARALEVERPADKERVFRVTVPLPPNEPTVRLRAVAYDSELLKSRPAELFLQRAGMKEQPGKLYLLAIGVSRYQNPAWNTLQYADADAKAFAETFGKAQGGQYEKVEQRLLTDQEATVSNVKFALRGLKDTVTEGDVAVVFAAGHGIEQAGDYYFLCHDTKEADLANTALPWQDFVNVLREVRAKRLLLFVDTCHAGFVTGWRTTDNLIDRLNRKAGALVFSASRGEEASMERADWGHGAFTKGLLEGLEGKADTENDGRITLQELRDFVIPRVEELTDNRQHPYLPRLQEFEPQAVVARSIGGVS